MGSNTDDFDTQEGDGPVQGYEFELGDSGPSRGSRKLSNDSDLRRSERRKSSGSVGHSDENVSNSGQEKQQRRSRASGEILELLIAEFNKSSNPASSVRKAISTKTGMSERSVRIWFQNRRAKQRKMEKMKKERAEQEQQLQDQGFGAVGQESGDGTAGGSIDTRGSGSSMLLEESLPMDVNEKYSLIDCRSLSVGQWQRIRSGLIDRDALSELHNLSPRLLNSLLDSTDLLVILSKKDHELNYFFSGVFQNEKVLFRIFFPVVNVVRTSFIDNQTQNADEDNANAPSSPTQLLLELTAPPKFAVHFLRDPVTGRENANQWSICEDFSEGQQVVTAHVGEGGTGIPHILTGSLPHLQYLNTAILSYCQVFAHSSFPGPSAEPQLFQPAPLPQGSPSSVPTPTVVGQPTPISGSVIATLASRDNNVIVSSPNGMNLADISRSMPYQMDPYQGSTNSPLNIDANLVNFQNAASTGTPSQLADTPGSLSLGLSMGINPLSVDNTKENNLIGNGNNHKQVSQLGSLQGNDAVKMESLGLDIFQSGERQTVDGNHLTPEGLMLTNEAQMLSDAASNLDNSQVQQQDTSKNEFDDMSIHKDSDFTSPDFFMDDNVNGLDF
ncbi:DEKNAAC102988 [Brettanomyces naardenensis]|uniref:DEKNAAC102988 n=1 Tax=Brettanomyces naardenensis TaxID=13370 RepID=A0A448YMA0_BRENA|nr:DEKNAAC102988 [Brettanomyces naardenensis]